MMFKQIFKKIFYCLAVTSALFMAGGNLYAADALKDETAAAKPAAAAAEKNFTFGEVLEGEVVTHAYTIANQGTVPLKILKVHTSCGCTTAKRPEQIPAGGKDQIVVKVDTIGYGGHYFDKTIVVETNDPEQKRIELRIQGPVESFADIWPKGIALIGKTGEIIQKESTITPTEKYPFKIIQINPSHGLEGKIDVRMENREGNYQIIVKNRQAAAGKYRGKLIIKTDSPIRPELTLFVNGIIKDKNS